MTTDCAVAAQVISEVDHADEIAACRAEAKADVACANALALGSTYDVCMADVEQLPCDGVVEKLNLGQAPELPSSCRGIVVASP